MQPPPSRLCLVPYLLLRWFDILFTVWGLDVIGVLVWLYIGEAFKDAIRPGLPGLASL
jgi:hypothetical protein